MMKANFLKTATWSMALCASMAAFTACSNDDENTIPSGGNGLEGNVLGGVVTSDLVLEANASYVLNGQLQVKAPATLTIPEGVTITANNDGQVDYILIEKGAKINAKGTAEKPIVMTAEVKEAGAWGGLHLCGDAPTNSGTGKSEIGDAAYGGNNANDNSGVLEYVRLEYTGYAFDSEHESNGVSFYGVGNGTKVSYLQAYKGSDDGLEFFGGTVNVDHCVVVDCTDDSFDWTEGWSGTASDLVAYQTDPTCDCLIEADNNGNSFDATPVSHPVLSNLYLVGNNSSDNKRGVRLRAGTQVSIDNMKVTGKANNLTIETKQTDAALKNGTSVLKNVKMAGVLKNSGWTDEDGTTHEGTYTSADFIGGQGNEENQTIGATWNDIAGEYFWVNGWTKTN